MQALLKAGATTEARSSDGGTALMVAASQGHAEVVRSLVRAGAQVNAREQRSGVTALMYGAEQGSAEIVRLLLDAGADMNVRTYGGWMPLRTRVRRASPWSQSYDGPGCYMDGVRMMIEMQGADRAEPFYRAGWTALIVAAAQGHAEVVRYLLAMGAFMNVRSEEGATPLGYAWHHKHTEVIRLLSAAGAELVAPNRVNLDPSAH